MRKKSTNILTLFALFISAVVFTQVQVSGVVKDDTGEPLPGVYVESEGGESVETNMEGEYTITANQGEELTFSFIGLEDKVEKVTGKSLNVTLGDIEEGSQIEETVVIAYGKKKKEDITGSVGVVDEAIIENTQAENVTKALQGSVSGVQVTKGQGRPGSDAQIRIRGIGSINGSSTPLYVVDGVPFNGNIDAINPNDIASMTVLKDAVANSLYGSKGSNGVIIITTKKGKTGKPKITLNSSIGFISRGVEEYDIIRDPGQYYEMAWSTLNNKYIASGNNESVAAQLASQDLVHNLGYNIYDVADDAIVNPSGKLNPNANLLYKDSWEDEMFKTGVRKETNFAISGSNENASYYFSAGMLETDSYLVNAGYDRYNTRFKLDYNLTDQLKVGGGIGYAKTKIKGPDLRGNSGTYSNPFSWSRNVAPIYPVYRYNTNGALQFDRNGHRLYDWGTTQDGLGMGTRTYGALQNPVGTSYLDVQRDDYNNVDTRLFASYDFLNDFNFTYNFAYDVNDGRVVRFDTPLGGDAYSIQGRGREYSNRRETMTNQQLLNWNKDLGNHSLDVLLGHETTELRYFYLNGEKTGFLSPDNSSLNSGSVIVDLDSYTEDYITEGYFARLDYNYASKYYLTASFRRDGSSVFSKENRWGNFWALGGSWRISKENFLKEVDWINELKLKAGYGTQGNDNLWRANSTTRRNYYAWADYYDFGVNDGRPGVGPFEVLGDRALTWEKSETFNTGIDFELFNKRLRGSVEYFDKRTSDLIFANPLPPSTGAQEIPENIGNMKNVGVEFDLAYDILKKDNFNWTFSVNATHFKNEITKLPEEEQANGGIQDGDYRLYEGKSRYDFFIRNYAGVDENGKALWYIDEEDADGNVIGRTTTSTYSEATRYYSGNPIPDVYGGFTNTFRFANIDLSIVMAYQIGGEFYDSQYAALMSAGDELGQNWHKDALNAWSPNNTNSNIPILDQNQDVNAKSDRFLTDASYLSINNITLGYSLPDSVLEEFNIDRLRFYVSGDNLALWSKRKGADPRQFASGETTNNYTVAKTITVGVNINF
ncbi:MAG: SusC/RagA family TonB-linked outer membrane protein [Flavobacteriales bacterium]